MINVVVLSGQTTGSAPHGMGGAGRCGKPNPNTLDNIGNAYASADDTTVTVTCEVPVSSNVTFTVPVMI